MELDGSGSTPINNGVLGGAAFRVRLTRQYLEKRMSPCSVHRGISFLFSTVVLLAMLGFQSSCDGSSRISKRYQKREAENYVNKRSSLDVEVASFKARVIHDDFDDGNSSSYDLTVLRVLNPGAYYDAKIQIVHPGDSASEPWKLAGQRCAVKLDDYLLENPDTLIPANLVEMSCRRS